MLPESEPRRTTLMKKKSLAETMMLVALALLFAARAPAITWGEDDTDRYRNVGAFGLGLAGEERVLPACSGTLIHPRVFLTAGHCTAFAELFLAAGIADRVVVNFDPGLEVNAWMLADSVVTHPDYSGPGATDTHDIGAVILEEAPAGILPATLPEEGFLDDLRDQGLLRQGKEEADFTLVGYGATLDFPPPQFNWDLRRRYAESEYQALLKAWLRMSQNQATGDGGTCAGDSGGPAFWTDPETAVDILVGITSWGDSPCVAIGFNYRTDTAPARAFIADVIAFAENDG
jgi:hypothetical protein